MPTLKYGPEEAHALLGAADAAAADGAAPELVDLYRQLATVGIDLDACTPDEDLRAQLGMPPLPDPDTTAATGHSDGRDGGNHPRVA